jgi:hypothetical protein
VEKLWGRVETVGPHYGSRLVVHANLSEILKIAQSLTQSSAQQERAVDIAHDAIVERNPDAVPLY